MHMKSERSQAVACTEYNEHMADHDNDNGYNDDDDGVGRCWENW